RIECLLQFEARPELTRTFVARIAGQPAEYEAVEPGVVAGEFEPQRPSRPPQPDLDRFRGFDAEIGIADVERGGGIMRAAREQLGRLRRAFDILAGHARHQIPWQILDQADAGALRRKMRILRCRGTDAGGIGVYVEYERNEGRHCAGEIDVLDAPGNLR